VAEAKFKSRHEKQNWERKTKILFSHPASIDHVMANLLNNTPPFSYPSLLLTSLYPPKKEMK
jgi:hypothetical protein